MAKSLVVFIILLVIQVVINGCTPLESKSVETTEVVGLGPGLDQNEPNNIASVDIEPDKIETVESLPEVVEPARSEPNDVEAVPARYFNDKCVNILKEFVNDYGMVDYQRLKRKRLELIALLREFDGLDPNEYKSWSREDKIAFWINVYNLQKLNIVTENYPITPSSRILTIFYRGTNSIRHIEGKIAEHKFLVMDEEFTFATIEKRFFRGEFDDPRIFFAISSACLSSPSLRNQPYYGDNLSEQLDEQTLRFLSSPLAFSIDREKQKVYLSALFQPSWYGREFLKKFAIDRKFKDQPAETRAVLNFITNYISKEDVSFLETGNYTIKYMTFDWSINDGS
jgi:hypothetical protein